MPTRRRTRYESNAKRIASFGLTDAKIWPKRCGGGWDRLEYAFYSEKTHFGLPAVENTLSSGEGVFRACERQNTLSN